MKERRIVRSISVGGFVALSLTLAASPALAQSSGQPSTPPAQTSPAPQVDVKEQELKSFASAVVQLQEIKQSYSQKIGQAGDKQKAQEIQGKMQEDMRRAIKDQGLSVERYTEIGQAVQNDPELRQQVNQLVKNR